MGVRLHRDGGRAALVTMEALDLLRLQIEWGVDEALQDTPADRLRPVTPARPRPPPTRVPAPPVRATPAERAIAAAATAATLGELRTVVAAFDGCALRDTAAHLVFAHGEPATGMLLIGDPPGEAEDRAGTPFAGAEGALLERMLASVSLTRQDLLLTPLIPWRPPGGRPPNAAEIAACLPFLHRLVVLSGARHVIVAGALAARSLLASSRRRSRPAWTGLAVPGLADPVPCLVMPSLAEVVRSPPARREAWGALRLVRRKIDGYIAKK